MRVPAPEHFVQYQSLLAPHHLGSSSMSVQDKEWPVENNSSPAQPEERQYHPSMRPHPNGYMQPYVQDHPHTMYVTFFVITSPELAWFHLCYQT